MVESVNGNGSTAPFAEQPYRWSQRWFDDPPPGTTVNLGEGMAEVYLGGGVWRTIAQSELPDDRVG